MAKHAYYSPSYAANIKAILLGMKDTPKKGRIIDCETTGFTLTTLYLRVVHGWRYLEDNDPEKEIFRDLRCRINIQKVTSPNRIRLSWKKAGRLDNPLVAEECDQKLLDSEPQWKTKLDKFLTTSLVGTSLVIRDLDLTEKEVADTNTAASETKDVNILKIDSSIIKLFKGSL